jgi:tetratricopeptide (TPR) repeat protein
MKRTVLLTFSIILLIFLNTGNLYNQEKKRILFDEYHAFAKPSDHLKDIISKLENRGYALEFLNEQMDFSLLSEYDVLVVLIPSRDFYDDEKEAIKSFVENGGSLIIFGEHGDYVEENNIGNAINSISAPFGIEFNKDIVLDSEKNRQGEEKYPILNNFKQHPITRGVKSIGYISGCSLTVHSPAIPLMFGNSTTITAPETQRGGDVVVLAVAGYGKGKVLAIGDADFLVGSRTVGYRNEDYLSFMNNEEFALNIFEWTASIRKMNREAEKLILEGKDLFSQRDYLQAKSKYENALEIYKEIDNSQLISEMQETIVRCSKGFEAEVALQRGTEYYRNKEYDNALREFERSKTFYDEIGDCERSQYIQSMIDECTIPLDAKAAYEKGNEYYDNGKYGMAITKFRESIDLYEKLGNNEKIEEIKEKTEEAQAMIDEIESWHRMLSIIGIFLTVLIVFILVYVFMRKPERLSKTDVSRTESVLCYSCGKKSVKGASYCSYCGASLKSLDELEKEGVLADLQNRLKKGEINEEEYSRLIRNLRKEL